MSVTIINTKGMALIGPGSEWFWAALQFTDDDTTTIDDGNVEARHNAQSDAIELSVSLNQADVRPCRCWWRDVSCAEGAVELHADVCSFWCFQKS